MPELTAVSDQALAGTLAKQHGLQSRVTRSSIQRRFRPAWSSDEEAGDVGSHPPGWPANGLTRPASADHSLSTSLSNPKPKSAAKSMPQHPNSRITSCQSQLTVHARALGEPKPLNVPRGDLIHVKTEQAEDGSGGLSSIRSRSPSGRRRRSPSPPARRPDHADRQKDELPPGHSHSPMNDDPHAGSSCHDGTGHQTTTPTYVFNVHMVTMTVGAQCPVEDLRDYISASTSVVLIIVLCMNVEMDSPQVALLEDAVAAMNSDEHETPKKFFHHISDRVFLVLDHDKVETYDVKMLEISPIETSATSASGGATDAAVAAFMPPLALVKIDFSPTFSAVNSFKFLVTDLRLCRASPQLLQLAGLEVYGHKCGVIAGHFGTNQHNVEYLAIGAGANLDAPVGQCDPQFISRPKKSAQI